MQQEIATILREAADRIASIVEPPVVPAPPEGYHLPALGPVKGYALAESGDIRMWLIGTSEWTRAEGVSPRYYYAIRKGSKLAVLNGLEPEPAKPTVEPAPFKLEAGKKYTRRDGQVVGPLEAYSWHATATYAFHFHDVDAWTENGEWFKGSTNFRDLVSEYVEPEPEPAKPTPTQEQVDELVAAASVTLGFLRGVKFSDGGLARALAPFSK